MKSEVATNQEREPRWCDDVDACVDAVIERVGKRVVLTTPIGIGKPVHVLNAFYQRALADPNFEFVLATGLSVSRPKAGTGLEQRFLGPFLERVFGDYPDLDYVAPYTRGHLPDNVKVIEFYMRPGAFLRNPVAQQHYLCANYTHVARDVLGLGVNVFAQTVARKSVDGETRLSLSSNADSLELLPVLRADAQAGRPTAIIGQVNENVPFMYRDAMLSPEDFDYVVDARRYDHTLFAPPSPPVEPTDYHIGLNASALVRDGGTLQIGIGSLGDAIAYGCRLRHQDNGTYRQVLNDTGLLEGFGNQVQAIGGTSPFEKGLYGASEMFADAFRHLYEAGILKRRVYDDASIQRLLLEGRIDESVTPSTLDVLVEAGVVPSVLDAEAVAYLKRFGILDAGVDFESGQLVAPSGERIPADLKDPAARERIHRDCLGDTLRGGTVLHAGFYLGPRAMYDMLAGLDRSEAEAFCMTSIGYVNQLYGHQTLATLQRQHARFVNTCMMATLLGAACSDGLDTGQVVSGVGGQYDFVAQAHALPGARSVLMLRSTRTKKDQTTSNLVWSYGHITIPRHLRDVVVTEYGVADLRGRTDAEVIGAMLNITDSRFQDALLRDAKRVGKLPADYQIPDRYRANTPERLADALAPHRARGLFPAFPFGSDFTEEEQVLGKVLKGLKAKTASKTAMVGTLVGAVATDSSVPPAAMPYLERMGLNAPQGLEERMLQRLLLAELRAGGYC